MNPMDPHNLPDSLFREYRAGLRYKNALGGRGMAEQNRINGRFYIGDQWHGARCGESRPLVRHNIIKRIADYKMAVVGAGAGGGGIHGRRASPPPPPPFGGGTPAGRGGRR